MESWTGPRYASTSLPAMQGTAKQVTLHALRPAGSEEKCCPVHAPKACRAVPGMPWESSCRQGLWGQIGTLYSGVFTTLPPTALDPAGLSRCSQSTKGRASWKNVLPASLASFGQSRLQLQVGPGCSKVPCTQVLRAEHRHHHWLFPLLCRHQRVREPAWDLLPGHLPEPGRLLPLYLPPWVRGAERQLHR